jgi:hypothetical protein
LDKNLQAYTAAANAARVGKADRDRLLYGAAVAAAGLGIAGFAPPAEAKIVYKSTNIQINSALHLDLNGDGINDFTFYFFKSVKLSNASGSFLSVVPSNFSSNGAIGKPVGTTYPASVLASGVQVGPKNSFRGFAMAERWRHTNKGTSTFLDPWAGKGQGVTSGYLGLKFAVKKKIHYGWARLSVNPGTAVATLTGYAYDTVAGEAIMTGQTEDIRASRQESKGAVANPSGSRASTLGALALGSQGRSR